MEGGETCFRWQHSKQNLATQKDEATRHAPFPMSRRVLLASLVAVQSEMQTDLVGERLQLKSLGEHV